MSLVAGVDPASDNCTPGEQRSWAKVTLAVIFSVVVLVLALVIIAIVAVGMNGPVSASPERTGSN